MGGPNPVTGQKCYSDEQNVKLIPGVGLTLTVPGGKFPHVYRYVYHPLNIHLVYVFLTIGQSVNATKFSGASITFPDIALGGMWQVEAQVSNVPGVIYNTFTNHGDPWSAPLGWQDEQDLAIYTSSLLTKTQYRPAAGMQMNNFDPV